ncbi:hypothetical protein CA12_06040 [Alienimonas californiensis]|uniref:Uncharacterized protein n=2 Tax=Alienimonas californiensis TaxID=2527989 RepID=A0A517P573_9PLAN|nr:hypothetical protein CA12_06040 [Alienimonas californiensis]
MPPLPKNPVEAMMPAGGMPALPKTPPKTPWVASRNPSAHIVQQQYVETRSDEIEANRLPGRAVALAVLEAEILRNMPERKRPSSVPFKELWRVYREIERNLQTAELTVNFKCETWFTNPNPYDTYTQMYQRAIEGGRMVLRNTDQNDADLRGFADNMVTFPKSWTGDTPPQRGLKPGRQSPARIRKQMDTGDLIPIHSGDELPAFLAGNPHFNPHTKQAFLALNYGRRPHGSAINYGHSYFVVKNELKPTCFYYAQDTFMRAGKGVDAGAIQVPYNNLGALLEAGGSPFLRESIFKSCYCGERLKDAVSTECKYYLIEAHRFGELTFGEHVEHMAISRINLTDQTLWPQIVANAKEFTRRNDIKLYQIE